MTIWIDNDGNLSSVRYISRSAILYRLRSFFKFIIQKKATNPGRYCKQWRNPLLHLDQTGELKKSAEWFSMTMLHETYICLRWTEAAVGWKTASKSSGMQLNTSITSRKSSALWIFFRRPVCSVGGVSDHRERGRGFEPWPYQHSGSLNN